MSERVVHASKVFGSGSSTRSCAWQKMISSWVDFVSASTLDLNNIFPTLYSSTLVW